MSRNIPCKIGFALLIPGLCLLYSGCVEKPRPLTGEPTPQQIQAKRAKEEYLKTRPWYERASASWSEHSPRYTKGISKALGADERAVWDVKRQMDSLGMDNTLDYYQWLESQKGKQ